MSKTFYILLLPAILAVAILIGCKSSNDDDSQSQDDQVLVTITPADNAVNVSTQSTVTVNFDHSMMAMDDMDEMFMLHQGWGIGMVPVAVTYSWNSDNSVLTMRPTAALEENMTYTVHLMGMMMGTDGMMYHMMMDTMEMGGMGNGMMMGGMGEDEVRTAFSTGSTIVHQITLDISQDVVFVADGGSGDIAVIDPATNTLIGIQPIDSVGFLHHLYLSADRTKLIVSDPNEDLSSGHESNGGHGGENETMVSRIILLDSRTLLETNRITFEGMTHNATMTPDGEFIIAANSTHNIVHKYSASTLAEVGSYTVGASPLEVTLTPDGEHALTANNGSGTVSKVHFEEPAAVQQVSVGNGPVGAWITPDGTQAWVTNEVSKTISVITIEPFVVDTTLALGYTPGQAIQNPTRREVYVADEDNGSVHVFDLVTRTWVANISTGSRAHGVSFRPDGSRAYVTNEMDKSVSVIDCESRTVVATIDVGVLPNGIIYRSAL
jgi:YVTN family beta-propeller protein